MVTHEREFLAHLGGLPSAERYVGLLRQVAAATGRAVTPQALRSEADVDAFAAALADSHAEKSVQNYRSVLRHYVAMVQARGL